jgi:hypothetical protein
MTRIPEQVRDEVAARARGCCEYCQTQERIVIRMEVDHIVPRARKGTTVLNNLCFACPQCNLTKSDYQTGIDPETNEEIELFNPRNHKWSEHFRWSDDLAEVIGISHIGRATVQRLDMNAPRTVRARHLWIQVGWHPPQLDE